MDNFTRTNTYERRDYLVNIFRCHHSFANLTLPKELSLGDSLLLPGRTDAQKEGLKKIHDLIKTFSIQFET